MATPRMLLTGLLATLALGCAGSDDDAPASVPGDTPCAKWTSLSELHGCSIGMQTDGGCELTAPAACDGLANAWLDCSARDPDQCYCESDDDGLNCEGSYKPDEGPALCVEEFTALAECAGF